MDVALHPARNTEVDRLALRLRVAGALERAIGVGPVEVVVLDEAPLRQIGARDDADLFAEADALPAAKYRLVVVVEAATDVADHLNRFRRTQTLDELRG